MDPSPPTPPPGWNPDPLLAPQTSATKSWRVLLFVGIGCAVLALGMAVLVFGGAAFYLARRSRAAPPAARLPAPVVAPNEAPPTAAALEPRDMRTFRDESTRLRTFVCELVNTGASPIAGPTARVTIYDAQHTTLDAGDCYTVERVLAPGQKVPCSIVLTKDDGYTDFKTEVSSRPYLPDARPAELRVSDVKVTPKGDRAFASLQGRVANGSGFTAKAVTVIVSLYGADGRIVAAQFVPVAGGDLEPGGAARFAAEFSAFAAEPKRYETRALGYE